MRKELALLIEYTTSRLELVGGLLNMRKAQQAQKYETIISTGA
jgi:hypothetical protein